MTRKWKLSAGVMSAMLVMATMAPVALAQETDTKDVAATITQMEKAGAKAAVDGNVSWFENNAANDYTMGTSWGTWQTKQDMLKGGPDNKTTKHEVSEVKVRTYGDSTAIATFKETYDMMMQGKHLARTVLTTDTWVNEGGTWKLVASHSSQADQKIGD